MAERHFERIAGRLALDFVNTVSGYRRGVPLDYLERYQDLLSWARQSGLLEARAAALLVREADAHPRRAAQALAEAQRLREALHDVVLAVIEGRPPPDRPLGQLNGWIASALSARRLLPDGQGRLALDWEAPRPGDLLFFLRPVAAEAAEMLARDPASGRLRCCAEAEAGNCGWLFFDESRNGARRFCSMSDCGNRAKARRHYRRVVSSRGS